MTAVIVWGVFLLFLTNVITGSIAWRRGVKNGEKWQKYRQKTGSDIDNMPYGDRFRKDLNLDPADWAPIHHVRRRKIHGQWTED
jgi:hypothetical protein